MKTAIWLILAAIAFAMVVALGMSLGADPYNEDFENDGYYYERR
jgi:hypothetical protein